MGEDGGGGTRVKEKIGRSGAKSAWKMAVYVSSRSKQITFFQLGINSDKFPVILLFPIASNLSLLIPISGLILT